MADRTRRIFRITFTVFGWLTAVLFVVTEVGSLLFWYVWKPATGMPEGVIGGVIYLGLALVCFYASWRLKASALQTPCGPAGT
jgi:hypothetical protein